MRRSSETDEPDTFRDLIAWQKAMDLTTMVYEAMSDMPSNERFELATQMRKAAVAIPSNIAEGKESKMDGVYLRHVRIARGSLAELETQIEICRRSGLLPESTCRRALDLADTVGALITGLAASLQ